MGSTFFFTLPLARPEPHIAGAHGLMSAENRVTAPEQSTAESRQPAGIVLVVEDRIAAAHASYTQKPILADRLIETMERVVR